VQEVQSVHDKPDHFDAARDRIETISGNIDGVYQRHRFCCLLGTNVMSHLEAMAAINMAGPESGIEVPAGASAYDVYLRHTAGFDFDAASEAFDELMNDHPLTPVYDYFAVQADQLEDIRQQDSETAVKQGKIAEPSSPVPYKSYGVKNFFTQVTRNAAVTTMDQVMQGAMSVALRHDTLPDPEDITRLLFEDHGFEKILSYSEVIGLVLRRQKKGPEAGKRWSEDSSEKREQRPIDAWNAIIRNYVEKGTLSVLTGAIGRFLLEKEMTGAKSKMHGHCGGSFAVRPHELQSGTHNRERAEAFFADRGVILHEGRFSAAGYQLARGLAVAEPTIFSDPTYRAAMEDIAKGIRESAT